MKDFFSEILRLVFISGVFAYKILNPFLFQLVALLGFRSQCLYPETCSNYAMRQLKESPSVYSALIFIGRRLMSCGPWASIAQRVNLLSSKENEV